MLTIVGKILSAMGWLLRFTSKPAAPTATEPPVVVTRPKARHRKADERGPIGTEIIPSDRRSGLRLAAAIDVETTGTAHSDEVIELAIALFAFDPETYEIAGVSDSYWGRREPAVAINPFAQRVHGISMEELRGCSMDLQRIARIAADADFLVAHNAPFDQRFVANLVPETSGQIWVCSMSSIDWSGCRSRKLKDIRIAHGITDAGAHTALADVSSLVSVLAMRNASGLTYLGELLTNCGIFANKHTRKRAHSA